MFKSRAYTALTNSIENAYAKFADKRAQDAAYLELRKGPHTQADINAIYAN